MAESYGSRAFSAALEMFINATRRYGKPAFGIEETVVDGAATPVVEEVVWSRPFCKLLHFRRESAAAERRDDPKVLMVAPMSGHYATLLRGTVRDMLPTMTSTSPTGPTRATCRWRWASSTSTTMPTT